MLRLVTIILAMAIVQPAFAKRGPIPKVESIFYQGVEFTAPNDDGRRAYVEAWDVRSKKKLWDLTIFKNVINPKIEEDVQWVYITKLQLQRHKRVSIVAEGGRKYFLNIETRSVKRQ